METERGSDELLGAEAIDQTQAQAFVENLKLGQEEMATREVEPEDDDEDTEFDDEAPPDAEEHVEYDELPPPVQEI